MSRSKADTATGAKALSSSEDLRLIALAATGDMDAFEGLYRLYHPRLSRFLINIVRRPQLVEEVLNETMLVVWQRAGTFQGASKLSTWIFAIAYRKAMKALRRLDEPVEGPDMRDFASDDAGPEEELEQVRLRQILMKAMDELSADHRAVVTLTYFQELGYREIAEIMDCPIDTVKTRMFHARRHLRRQLEGALGDWI